VDPALTIEPATRSKGRSGVKWFCGAVLVFVVNGMPSGPAGAAECVGLAAIGGGPLGAGVQDASKKDGPPLADCGSLTSVLKKVARQGKVGGRQLEKDRPLNVAEAEANLATARRNPAVRRRLERVAAEVQEPAVRLAYEAAVLDEEGFYAARDLKIQQLQRAVP